MPRHNEIKKVMVIGSGPIVIGQAAEFDYAGTQACRSLREEGIEVVLVNSNPATIMTDLETADVVYVEPLTVEFLSKIIQKERPDGLLPTLGGQTGLNLAVALSSAGVLEKYSVRLLGTSLESIQKAEDRELFKALMEDINEPVPESKICLNLYEAQEIAVKFGFPLIVRPAYTLGGTGGGIVRNENELIEIVSRGIQASMIHQVLVEQCVGGWKEIEYEVMRDGEGNCITICNMENFDAMGVHTGDSIVVAPSQTLSDKEYQMLRTSSLKIINALGIEGGCNVQYALSPKSFQYYVIEVNPRVSRSSALASKATGYPIARVASKIAVGLRLDEIRNKVTGETFAAFEPALDYIVTKIPRWPFDKFSAADRTVGTQMKSTGEVMAIERTFEASLMKAVRSLEIGVSGPKLKGIDLLSQMQIESKLETPTDERLFVIFEAFRRGMLVEEIHQLTNIDVWFLHKIKGLVDTEKQVKTKGIEGSVLKAAKQKGFSDKYLAELTGKPEKEIRERRRTENIMPVYKIVDTCAAEFEAKTPYYYSTYDTENESLPKKGRRAVVIGSGPIRIGQGIEFDYCSVHCAFTLKNEGYQSVIINNNPETVSTDFDTSDRLYFEPLMLEDVLHVLWIEKPKGVVLQLGGQTPLNLAEALDAEKINILGTSQERIDMAEDRQRFDRVLKKLNIPRPPGKAVFSGEAARRAARRIGYPVLIRPSYVLGGRAMEIVYSDNELLRYMKYALDVNPEHPVLIDKYFRGREVEVDALCDGTSVLIPGIMEHIERAGVHSGDSMAVCPPRNLSPHVLEQLLEYTIKLALALKVKGFVNIQYVVFNENVYVLEVNPRASRTVPYLSKVVGLALVTMATNIMLGKKLSDLGFSGGLYRQPSHIGIKAPVFSFSKLTELDVVLGPEMKSTGEIMGIDTTYEKALFKALVASGISIPRKGQIVVTLADKDKDEALPVISQIQQLGYDLLATKGTADFLQKNNVLCKSVNKIGEGSPTLLDVVRKGKVVLLINTLSTDKTSEKDAAKIRRVTVECSIPCLTSLDTVAALLQALEAQRVNRSLTVCSLNEFHQKMQKQKELEIACLSADTAQV